MDTMNEVDFILCIKLAYKNIRRNVTNTIFKATCFYKILYMTFFKSRPFGLFMVEIFIRLHDLPLIRKTLFVFQR